MIAPLFVYVLTFVGAVASLSYPFVGLLVYVFFGILKPEYFWSDSVPQGNYSRIVAAALVLGWALWGFGDWRLGKARAIAGIYIVFWLWGIASASAAANQDVAWQFVADMAKIVFPLLIGLTLIDSITKLKLLAWVIILSQSIIALAMNIDYWGGFNRMKEVGFAGMDNNSASIPMVTCLGVAFFLGMSERTWRRALAFTAALLMAHAVLISSSRGGMLAMLIMAFAGFLLIPRRPIHYVGMAMALVLLVALSTDEARTRFQSSFADESKRDASAQSRLKLWKDCWEVTLKNPILGCGPNHWPLLAKDYGWPPGKQGHSLWLQTGAELGFPGVGLLAAFHGLAIVRLWRLVRAHDGAIDPWFSDGGRMVIAALVGFAVAAQFVTVIAVELPYFVTLLGAGVLKVSSTQTRQKVSQRATAKVPDAPSLATAALT